MDEGQQEKRKTEIGELETKSEIRNCEGFERLLRAGRKES